VTLESQFPLEHISTLAEIESQRRQFYRPIYSIHKSWARRPGSTFRAIGLAYFTRSPLFDINKSGKGAYYINHDFKHKIALDPFCGGGTSLVELHRLGVKTVGFDINPIALFTTKKELDPFDLSLFNQIADELTQQIGGKLKTYYHTHCPQCQNKTADIMYTFWVRTIRCPSCHALEDLFKYYIIGKKQRKNPATMIICPDCDHLFYSLIPVEKSTSCPECEFKFVPNNGNCRKKEFTCTSCNQSFRLLDVLKTLQYQWATRQIAIEYFCNHCGTRDYKPISNEDKRQYEHAKTEFKKLANGLPFPREEIPIDASTASNLKNYGFNRFEDLFNFRQLLCLSLLLQSISQIGDQNHMEYFAAAFSSSLEFHTVLCPYNYTMKQIVNVFNYQTFLVPTMFVENNVWGTKKGNGTFITYLDRIRKAKAYCQAPFEISLQNGLKVRVPIKGDSINAGQASSFWHLQSRDTNDVLLQFGSSEKLMTFIPSESIDLILTDPPYLDYIQYSEIANFFYVWLKRLLSSSDFPGFHSNLIKSDQDLGSQKNTHKFRTGLSKVFKECFRVLKTNAPLIFTFHHAKSNGWNIILTTLAESGFQITAALPIRSEFGARPVKGLNFDFILICRKTSSGSKKILNLSLEGLRGKLDAQFHDYTQSAKKALSDTRNESIFAQLLPTLSAYYLQERSENLNQALELLEKFMKSLFVKK
jgi:adenine-specific DNA methylase